MHSGLSGAGSLTSFGFYMELWDLVPVKVLL